jgi:hypothetical protein
MATASLRPAAALLIVGLLFRIPSMACGNVPACIEKWGTGRRIQVVLVTGGALTGHIGSIQPDGFTLGADKRGGDSRQLKYAELRSAKTKMTVGTKWLIAGVVYGIVTIFSFILGT